MIRFVTMELTIVRHGETTWNRKHLIQGQQDPPLSHVGRDQAERIAGALEGAGVACVYTSDLARACDTAEAVARHLGVPRHVRPELREVGMGEWEGLTQDEAAARDPDLFRQWQTDSTVNRPPGGESYESMLGRVARASVEIESRGENAAVVTHYTSGRALIASVLGAPLHALRWFRIDNGSLSKLRRLDSGPWQLTALNDTQHLAMGRH